MKKIKKIFCEIGELFISIKNNYPILMFFMIANIVNGALLRLLTMGTFSIRALFFDIFFVLLLSSFSLLFKKRGRITYYLFSSMFMIACCVVNAIYYNYYISFASISLLATSVFVKDVSDAVLDFAIKWIDWIYFWELIGVVVLIKKNKESFKENISSFKSLLVLSFVSLCIGSAIPPYIAWSRFVKLWNRVSVVNNFGVYVYQVDDLVQSLIPTFSNIFGYDKAKKTVEEYFKENKAIQEVNDYTKIFEGKNVIAIHAESLQAFTLGLKFNNKEVTPNINKLVSKGIYFSNFYAQVGVGTSSDTEFTYATSLLPANNGTVFVNYYNNKYVTIQNLLNNKGYYVFSMHGNVGDFWNRDTMHINMGYDKFYSKSSFVIDEEYGLGLSDESFFRQVVPMIKDIKNNVGEPYYGTLITLTNHTPWRDVNKFSDYKVNMTVNIDGKDITRDYLEGTSIGNYIKAVNYMDKAIGEFINNMDKAGLLDNTVIVVYGDHDARLGKKQFNYMYNYDPINDRVLKEEDPEYVDFNDYEYELSRKVPFIIWTKDMENSVSIDTPMGMIDVMPTLGNMLGVYNEYALGKDVMSIKKDDAIVVFKDGSFVTDKIYYSSKNSEAYAISSLVIDNDYIKKKSQQASKIVELSDYIITYDLLKDMK